MPALSSTSGSIRGIPDASAPSARRLSPPHPPHELRPRHAASVLTSTLDQLCAAVVHAATLLCRRRPPRSDGTRGYQGRGPQTQIAGLRPRRRVSGANLATGQVLSPLSAAEPEEATFFGSYSLSSVLSAGFPRLRCRS